MQKTSLKEKLEERVFEIPTSESVVIDEQRANIVPFKNEPNVVSVVPSIEITLREAKDRIQMLQEFVRDMMIEGIDYGRIPNVPKPTLFKSGAEKLCDIYGLSKEIDVINRIEDWKEGLFHYEVKAILRTKRTGLIEAEGIGCANNKEKKFSTQHPFTIVNTVLKMAKKRALIDAVLSATRSSALFTQDIEDLDPPNGSSQDSTNQPVANNSGYYKEKQSQQNKPITNSQLNKIYSLVEQNSIPVNKIRDIIMQRYQVSESKHLTLQQADNFIKFLINY